MKLLFTKNKKKIRQPKLRGKNDHFSLFARKKVNIFYYGKLILDSHFITYLEGFYIFLYFLSTLTFPSAYVS